MRRGLRDMIGVRRCAVAAVAAAGTACSAGWAEIATRSPGEVRLPQKDS